MIWILLIVFQLKHFVADYPLQTPYMLGKFKDKGWFRPLASHCGVQALCTFLISYSVLFFNENVLSQSLLLAALDFSVHFIVDRFKASPRWLGRYNAIAKDQYKGLLEARSLAQMAVDGFKRDPLTANVSNYAASEIERIDAKFKSNTYFWWALGFDQMMHHLTDILIIFLIVRLLNT